MATTAPRPNDSTEQPPKRDALASLRIERPDEQAPRVRRGGRRWRRRLAVLLIVAGLGTGGYLAIARGWVPAEWLGGLAAGDWIPEMIQNRPEVRLTRVVVQTGRSADATVVATGYIKSLRQARIGARAPGRIDTIHFQEGTVVRQSDLLAVLEHADLEASLAAAKAQVARAELSVAEQDIAIEQAKREWERAESLWSRQGIAEAEYDQARFTYASAKARRESLVAELTLAKARQQEAEQVRENMFIRAPFDGTVISKDAEVGESILPGGMGEASGRGSVATIADLAHLEIECDVKEDFINRVTEAQAAEVAIDAVPGRKYQGQVRKIIPMGDRARATIKVLVTIVDADERLFPEMSGTVYFLPSEAASQPVEEKPRMFCPASAVVSAADGKTAQVWTVDPQGHAQPIEVSTGERKEDAIEILSGLTGNERVIVQPGQLTTGQSVKVVE